METITTETKPEIKSEIQIKRGRGRPRKGDPPVPKKEKPQPKPFQGVISLKGFFPKVPKDYYTNIMKQGYDKAYYEAHREAYILYQKQYRQRPEVKAKHIYHCDMCNMDVANKSKHIHSKTHLRIQTIYDNLTKA
jgi:hypothetical protein